MLSSFVSWIRLLLNLFIIKSKDMTTLLQRVSAYTRLQLRWTCSLMAANAVSQLWNTLCLLMASHITTDTAYFFACRLPIFICILSSLFLLHHSSIYLVVIPAITSSHRTTTVHSSTTISWSDAFAHTYLILSSLFFFYHFFLASKLKYKAWRPVSQIAKMAELLR